MSRHQRLKMYKEIEEMIEDIGKMVNIIQSQLQFIGEHNIQTTISKFKETVESDFIRDCDLFDDIGTKKIYEIYEKTNDLNFGNFLFQLYSVERFVRKNNLAYKSLADTQ